jgi:hypothetical protein
MDCRAAYSRPPGGSSLVCVHDRHLGLVSLIAESHVHLFFPLAVGLEVGQIQEGIGKKEIVVQHAQDPGRFIGGVK